jgi:hypothetical protein
MDVHLQPCGIALSASQEDEEEEIQHTGHKMNSKMPVYAGSKCNYLPRRWPVTSSTSRYLQPHPFDFSK